MKRRKSNAVAEVIWPLPLAAVIASLWANVVLLVVTLLSASFIWILTAESSTEFSLALNIGVAFLAFSQFVTLQVGALTFGLAPLGVSFILLWFLKVAFLRALRASLITQALHLVMLSLTFAMSHAGIWWVITRFLFEDIQVSSGQMLLATSVFALSASIWAMLRQVDVEVEETEYETSLERTSPREKQRSARTILLDIYGGLHPDIHHGFRVAFRIFFVFMLYAIVLFLINGILNLNSVRQVAAISANDVGSWILLTLLTLLYVPTVVLWMYSLALGAGFSVGAGSVINLHTQAVGPLPSLPFLGFVPYDLPDWVAVSYVLVLLLATFVGFVNLRKIRVDSFRRFMIAFATLTVLLNSSIALLASGGIGSGRFEEVGISALMLSIWALVFAVLGLAGALLLISRTRTKPNMER